MQDQYLEKLADVLVNYSTGVKPGDLVSIKAEKVATRFIIAVAKEAIKKGALVDYSVTLPEVEELILKYGNATQLNHPNGAYGRAVKKSDVWITAWGSSNTRGLTEISPEILTARRLANKYEREIYVKRMGSGALRWVGTLLPTDAEAQEANMSLLNFADFVCKAGMLDKKDPIGEWRRVAKEQEEWVRYLDTKKSLHIVSRDTDLVVGINNRKWINCCGKMNFPDGEIFTSPEENNINGYISFNYPAIYSGRMVEGVKLEIKDGEIIKATASVGEDFLRSCINTDQGSKYFGEVAIGTNYNIKKFTRHILFDEKIGGTIHMAIGSAMIEARGTNMSAVHWDLICSMLDGGRIYADGELFYSDGNFIKSVLK